MAKLILFEKERNLEEYIVAEVCANFGTHTRIKIEDMKKILDKHEIPYKKKSTKKEMIYELYERFKDWGIVARELEVGVKVKQYTDAFPFVTKADIKRLEKFEVLKVIGYQSFRAYNKTLKAPLYDLVQFQEMTESNMRKLLEEYPKGKIKHKKV